MNTPSPSSTSAPCTLEAVRLTHEVPVRQVRLAVTMVGGTSLAIYENGVAQELFRLVHGQGVYGLLKRLTHSHAYVDLLSGTSAGGINSIFLSTALVKGTDLRLTQETWIRLGGIDDLLQDPHNTQARALLKGNEYYLTQLEDTFNTLLGAGRPDWRAPSIPSNYVGPDLKTYGEVDLFVTGTYVEGQPSTFFDARNQPLFSEDHNGVFHLKHRPGRRESHFHPALRNPRYGDPAQSQDDVARRLATIARSTSALPAVFEPALVTRTLLEGIIPLPREKNYFGDGGYLNNRPLNLVLPEIRRRPAGAEVLRKLVFVEPVAEGLRRLPLEDPPEPTALESVRFAAAVQGEQSLSDYLDAVHQHNRRVRRVNEAVYWGRQQLSTAHVRPEAPEFQLWVDIRLQELRDQILLAWERQLSSRQRVDYRQEEREVLAQWRKIQREAEQLRRIRTRLLAYLEKHCLDRATPLMPPDDPRAFELEDVDVEYLDRMIIRLAGEIRAALYPGTEYHDLYSGAPAAAGVQATTQTFRQSVFSLVREDYPELESCLQELYRLHDLTELIEEHAARVIATLGASPQFDALMTDEGLSEAAVDEAALGALWEQLERAIRYLLATPEDPAPTAEFRQALIDHADRLCSHLAKGEFPEETQSPDGPPPSLLRRIHEKVGVVAVRSAELLAAAFVEYPGLPYGWAVEKRDDGLQVRSWDQISDYLKYLDVRLFPIERAAELPCLNEIELVHVSARDVQVGLSRVRAKDKLAGDVLANLGGFFKRSWRVNDILWGRLDASGALVETLLDCERLARVCTPDNVAEIMNAIDGYILTGDPCRPALDREHEPDSTGDYLLNHYPDGSYAEAQAQIRSILNRLAVDEAPSKEEWRLLTEWLLRRHQLEILMDQVPAAVAEEISEHGEWQGRDQTGRYEGVLQELADRMQVLSGADLTGSMRDRLRTVARRLVDADFAIGSSRGPDARRVHTFFLQEYRIGRESVTGDIPALVNVRRALAVLLIALHVCQQGLSADTRARLEKMGLWKWVVRPLSLVLGPLYAFVDVLGQGPILAAAAHAVAWSIIGMGALLLLLANLDPATIAWKTILGLTLGTAAIQILLWRLRRPEAKKRRSTRQNLSPGAPP